MMILMHRSKNESQTNPPQHVFVDQVSPKYDLQSSFSERSPSYNWSLLSQLIFRNHDLMVDYESYRKCRLIQPAKWVEDLRDV